MGPSGKTKGGSACRCNTPLQSDANAWVRVLPATAASVRVSFYAATAQQLAPVHPVVQARRCWAACKLLACGASAYVSMTELTMLGPTTTQAHCTIAHNSPLQVLLEVCPNPRKGVFGAQLGRLATAAQRPPGVLLQASWACRHGSFATAGLLNEHRLLQCKGE